MTGLVFLIGIIVLLYLLSKRSNDAPNSPSPLEVQLETRNYEWAQFIAKYYATAQSKPEKGLIRRMLADIAAQGLPVPQLPDGDVADLQKKATAETAESVQPPDTAQDTSPENQPERAVPSPAQAARAEARASQQVQLDNASMLLYFGAFLFVASAGLFVAFGGLPGGVRAFIVLMVSVVMYAGGLWLNDNRKQLKQAAMAFAGIGMAVAPLTGLAVYSYVFGQTSGGVVWMATSVFCMMMYWHALMKLRKPLISYIFIFTFLSLFESGVSIINAPLYYYGWGMSIVGISLMAVSKLRGIWPELMEPASYSATLFVPLSVLSSIALIGGEGIGQAGVSLLLAAAYYGLQALNSTGEEQSANALASQGAMILSAGALAYAATKSLPFVSVVVAGLNVVQLAVAMLRPRINPLWHNFTSVVVGSQFVAVIFGFERPAVVFGLAGMLLLMAGLVWVRYKRPDMYVISALSLVSLPLVYGCMVARPQLAVAVVVALLLATLAVQFCLLLLPTGRRLLTDEWRAFSSFAYVASMAVIVVTSFWASEWVIFWTCLVLAASMFVIALRGESASWSVAAGLVIAIPLLFGWGQPAVFLAANAAALAANIALSLRYRQEFNRWFSTLLWLLLPLAAGALGNWSAEGYAWAYTAVMALLLLSRSVARGVILLSDKVPMASYARTASLSYAVGYSGAAVAAMVSSLLVDTGRGHATAILAIVTVAAAAASRYVEKRPDIMAFVPLLAQIVLWSAVRPTDNTQSMYVFLVMSTALAVISYFELPAKVVNQAMVEYLRMGALIAVFITPVSCLFVDANYWPLPIGMFVAAFLTYYHIRSTTQEHREVAGSLFVLAAYWLMWFVGVREVQAYSHVLVALFAFYAYWRHTRGEEAQADQYLMVMLAAATIPLVLQALDGQSGGLYGWWLLLEEVTFMLVGMTINKRIVTMWGLYVSVGAVLYQLRNLGWAALTVLAVFLIGLALYKLQKYNDN